MSVCEGLKSRMAEIKARAAERRADDERSRHEHGGRGYVAFRRSVATYPVPRFYFDAFDV